MPAPAVAVTLVRSRVGRRVLAAGFVLAALVLMTPLMFLASIAADTSSPTAAGRDVTGGGGDPVVEGDLAVVRGIRVHVSIAHQVDALLRAAEADGVVLAGWGWRDHKRQQELRIINGCDDVWTASPSSCRVPTAIPGTSMHERGLAIDFTYRGQTIKSRESVPFRWLRGNAHRFGLVNLPSEPWHWSVNGR